MKFTLDLSIEKIEAIKNRKIFLFDISIWNKLADKKTSEAQDICKLLIEKQREGSLFCPLTAPNIWELRKQAGKSLMRTARLMEQLSLNVVFRGSDQIFNYEIANFLKYVLTGHFVPLSHNQLFGSLLSYFSASFSVNYSCDISKSEQYNVLKTYGNYIQNISLTEFIRMLGENSAPTTKKALNYQATNIKRRKVAQGDKNKMKRIEIEHVANSIIIPKINKKRETYPLKTQMEIIETISSFPKNKKYGSTIEYILSFLPAISAYVHMLTISGYDINRKDIENDFHDREILIYGLSYATVFSAADRWIKSIIETTKKEGTIGVFCYAGSLNDLKNKL